MKNPLRFTNLFVLFFILSISSGCAGINHRVNPKFNKYFEKPVPVAIMPPDIKIFEFTAGNMQLYKDDWSNSARQNVLQALKDADDKVPEVELTVYEPSALLEADKLFLKSQQGLFNLVAMSILDHTYNPATLFADKKTNFDYTLGNEFEAIDKLVNRQAVLYCSGRNYIWTAGRTAMFLLASVVFGDSAAAIIPVGQEYFMMSIIDVKTGDVIWFDGLSLPGDLRNSQLDKKLIQNMLEKIPKALAKEKVKK